MSISSKSSKAALPETASLNHNHVLRFYYKPTTMLDTMNQNLDPDIGVNLPCPPPSSTPIYNPPANPVCSTLNKVVTLYPLPRVSGIQLLLTAFHYPCYSNSLKYLYTARLPTPISCWFLLPLPEWIKLIRQAPASFAGINTSQTFAGIFSPCKSQLLRHLPAKDNNTSFPSFSISLLSFIFFIAHQAFEIIYLYVKVFIAFFILRNLQHQEQCLAHRRSVNSC